MVRCFIACTYLCCGRRGTTRLPTEICTGSLFWLNVVVRSLTIPWSGRDFDGRTSSTSASMCSSYISEGSGEARASKWVSDPDALARLMTRVSCQGGYTQIRKVLTHARRESEQDKVNAVVYVGDCMEEDIDGLCQRAGSLGLLGTPMFLFQEGRDQKAERAFKEVARLTRGAYCHFAAGSAGQLRQLLAAVAVYATGGHQALRNYGKSTNSDVVVRLLEQLT